MIFFKKILEEEIFNANAIKWHWTKNICKRYLDSECKCNECEMCWSLDFTCSHYDKKAT